MSVPWRTLCNRRGGRLACYRCSLTKQLALHYLLTDSLFSVTKKVRSSAEIKKEKEVFEREREKSREDIY